MIEFPAGADISDMDRAHVAGRTLVVLGIVRSPVEGIWRAICQEVPAIAGIASPAGVSEN